MQDIREIKIELIQIQIGLDKLKLFFYQKSVRKKKKKPLE